MPKQFALKKDYNPDISINMYVLKQVTEFIQIYLFYKLFIKFKDRHE